MRRSEISRFQRVLEAKVIEFGSSTRRRDAIAIEAGGDAFDRLRAAGERELAVRNLEAESARLRGARHALGRIQQGTYGICVDCEERISPARLAALPWADRCIGCQSAVDAGGRAPAPIFPLAA